MLIQSTFLNLQFERLCLLENVFSVTAQTLRRSESNFNTILNYLYFNLFKLGNFIVKKS